MVANLLDNAIKYTLSGGTIQVSLDVVDDRLELKLSDNGMGIDEADIGSIFNRFYRAEPSRSGTGCGLGLSYARAVARLHGSDILVQSKKFDYTEFTVVLPCVSAEPGPAQLSFATST